MILVNMNSKTRKAAVMPRLVRTFVPTGEGRLAAVWSLVEETQTSTEDPSLSGPAWRTLLSRWRAFYVPAIPFGYCAG